MESQGPSANSDFGVAPPGFRLFFVSMFLTAVGIIVIVAGRNLGSQAVRLVGAAIVVAFALLALFGFIQWQWRDFRNLSSRWEKAVWVAAALVGITVSVVVEWLI